MIKLLFGDITKIAVDAIVNAANSSLLGGGGVDGAIHRAGGKAIMDECIKISERKGGCPAGEAVITTAGKLPARYVIHTVGPVWHGGMKNEDKLLASAYANSLRLAVKNGAKTIAFPNISTGVYGYPKAEASQIAVTEVERYLSENSSIEKVIFCCFDHDNYELYKHLINNQ